MKSESHLHCSPLGSVALEATDRTLAKDTVADGWGNTHPEDGSIVGEASVEALATVGTCSD